MKYQCGIFDLDGVLVDTAKYHYLGWKKLADRLGFPFTEQQNEALKGISRMAALDLLLEMGGMSGRFSEAEKAELAAEKNQYYLEYVSRLEEDELFFGVVELFERMKKAGIKIALGSASKNARLILDRLHIEDYFDFIVDGTLVKKAKPDPEVFTLSADRLGIPYAECVVFEDSAAGIQAAKTAGMLAVGIGTRENLPMADYICRGVGEFEWE
ncbi:beta-phosphoglucomutase [Lacrimispora sp. 210928-DFI.3.58]|uniref:beta-phosphoglucomutase n=1 Tax=Lacrimispora sp. 210928-DFI.3.58 TaxID=2883214 RepID=UPI001D092908|nr:beta-phosphoglucomutase [Lacrimispora sp. 210928-DFI.3.58]MCB7320762.1 beta-phosphoglucomutase [Lacrimispora sp. 210928-DFI.3.58]